MVDRNQETDPLKRAMRLGTLGMGIAGSYLGYQLQNVYLDREKSREKRKGMNRRNTERIRKEL